MIETATTIQQREARHGSGIYAKRDLTIVRGEGAWLWDDQGRRYIDCVGGHGSANVGHAHPAVQQAIAEQAGRLVTCPEIFYNDRRAALLELLAAVTPPGLDRFFLCNSGAEAVESAIKFARAATRRPGIVAAQRGFHGRTMGALSATWEAHYREPFVPLVPEFTHVPYDRVEALAGAVTEHTAAVILEVVQGEGGVRPASPGYLPAVARICREHGALLIIDEVQTGFGRTGRMFACEHEGIEPDLLCLAKSMGGGLPIGAVALGPNVGDLPIGSHGSTFGGNPLACAAAIAAIGVIRDQDLPARAAAAGARLLAGLRRIESPRVREVRGLGLMIGVDLRERVRPTLLALQARGVLALPAGMTTLRLLPPLVITDEQIDTVVQVVAETLATPAGAGASV
ncbi:MAG TPA: aspartate aminotransferase family protein [Chloroflexota bacterium]|nr:aspartate aminotransferase family protein [Chloroflexota bacterium]